MWDNISRDNIQPKELLTFTTQTRMLKMRYITTDEVERREAEFRLDEVI